MSKKKIAGTDYKFLEWKIIMHDLLDRVNSGEIKDKIEKIIIGIYTDEMDDSPLEFITWEFLGENCSGKNLMYKGFELRDIEKVDYEGRIVYRSVNIVTKEVFNKHKKNLSLNKSNQYEVYIKIKDDDKSIGDDFYLWYRIYRYADKYEFELSERE